MWDDSEFTSPDYSQYEQDPSMDMGGYDQVGQESMQNYDTSNFWDQGGAFSNVPDFNFGSFGQPQQQSDMFQTQNNFGQGLQPTTGLTSVGEFGNQGNLSSGTENNGWNLGSVGNTLSQLFNGQGGKGLASVLGALVEGRQNKKASQQNPQIIQQMRQQASPFDQASTGASQMGASSMRDAMQQKLASAMTDPYGQPIVKAQTDALAQAQAIKDAAAGRRSNNATSSPALIAEQAKIAQNYINSLQSPAGAGMSAGMSGLDQLLAASKSGINGYASPMMSALGYNQGGSNNTAQMDLIRQILAGGK